jgi:hypothetical protein
MFVRAIAENMGEKEERKELSLPAGVCSLFGGSTYMLGLQILKVQ